MGYHISILRTKNKALIPIKRQEIVEALNQLGTGSFDESSGTATLQNKNGESITLFLQDGELWAKGASSAALTAMLNLASSLNARVRGDDLETYLSATSTYRHPDDADLLKDGEKTRLEHLSKAKKRKLVWNIIRGIALLALVAGLLVQAFYQP
jgi:hypothetical protein